MLHHYPHPAPINQQILSIPPSLFTQPSLGHPSLSVQSVGAPLPVQSVSASYLASATTLYANLLQPLALKLIQAPPHATLINQHHLLTSTFGYAHAYTPHPVLTLSQCPPHVPLRPGHVILTAPSQHALHEFCAQSELLLPSGRWRIEVTEYGERCCVRDLDGNLIEITCALQHNGRSNGYLVQDTISRPPHKVQREREKSVGFSSHREQNRDGRRGRGKDRDVRVAGEERRLRQSNENDPDFVDGLPFEKERKPSKGNRRVLLWQKDVARSTDFQEDDYYSERNDDDEDSHSSEEDELPVAHYRSYSHSLSDYNVRPGRNNPYASYQDAYDMDDNHRFSNNVDDKYQESSGHRYTDRRQKQIDYRKDHDDYYVSQFEPTHESTTRRNQSKHRSDSFKNDLKANTVAGRRSDPYPELSSPTKYVHYRNGQMIHRSSKSTSANYESRSGRERRAESDHINLNIGGRRDSGIGGIGGFSGGEKDRGDLNQRPPERYQSHKGSSAITAKDRANNHRPKPIFETRDSNESRGYSKSRKGKERDRASRSGYRYQNSAYHSSVEDDYESSVTHSSDLELCKKPGSSRKAKEREIEDEKRRKWNDQREQVRNQYRKEAGKELVSRGGRKSHLGSNSHRSPVRSAVNDCPTSVSGSTMRGKGRILARVPQPPSALAYNARGRREMPETEAEYDDDYDESSDEFERTNYEYSHDDRAERSYRQGSSKQNTRRSYPSQRQSFASTDYRSRDKREPPPSQERRRYEYEASDVSSQSGGSFEDQREPSRRQSRRRMSGMR